MGLFGKKKNETPETTLKAIEKLIMEQLTDNDNKAAELVDSLKEGSPLIVNFAPLKFNAFAELVNFKLS